MRVSVIGSGYVGLVTGAFLAALGHDVTCLDIDEARVDRLNDGQIPIYEPGLDEIIRAETASGRLHFTSKYAEAVPHAEAIFICVGTPALPDGRSDTSYVEAAARSIGEWMGPGYVVLINKSTVPIGSGDWVGMLVRQGLRQRSDVEVRAVDFDVVSNPEFLREGTAVQDALFPDRIVIGAESDRAIQRMRELYQPLIRRNEARGRHVPFVVTDRASAEMIKYAANAFLATKISFINEMANICERVGADVREVARAIGMDHRIGAAFLRAGIGWGGSCFPKDLSSLVHTAREYGYQAELLEATQAVNRFQRQSVVRKLQERLKIIKGKRIAILGVAFKPETDDVRDSPALEVCARLLDLGAEVSVYDPKAAGNARAAGMEAEVVSDPYDAMDAADAVVLMTEWPEFESLDWERAASRMRRPLLLDGRNALDRARLTAAGMEYLGIGHAA